MMVWQKKNDVLHITDMRSGSNTVNALRQRGTERMLKAEIATLGMSGETRKNKRAQKRRLRGSR
jgi:hypothetical protein